MSETLDTTDAAPSTLPRWFPIPGIRFEMAELADTGASDETDAVAAEAEAETSDGSGAAEQPTEDVAASTEAASAFDINAPEVQQAIQEAAQAQLGPVLQALQGAFGGEEQTGPPPLPDPYDDDFQEKLEAREQWLVEQLDARMQPFQQQQYEQAASKAVEEAIGGKDDLSPDDVATGTLAFFHQANGNPQAAAQRAAEWLRARDKTTGDRAVEAYKRSMSQVADTKAEPGVGGAAIGLEKSPSSYGEITERFGDRFTLS